MLADAVIAGEDRERVSALAWLNPVEARTLLGAEIPLAGELVAHEILDEMLGHLLAVHNEMVGSAARIERLLCSRAQPTWRPGKSPTRATLTSGRC